MSVLSYEKQDVFVTSVESLNPEELDRKVIAYNAQASSLAAIIELKEKDNFLIFLLIPGANFILREKHIFLTDMQKYAALFASRLIEGSNVLYVGGILTKKGQPFYLSFDHFVIKIPKKEKQNVDWAELMIKILNRK